METIYTANIMNINIKNHIECLSMASEAVLVYSPSQSLQDNLTLQSPSDFEWQNPNFKKEFKTNYGVNWLYA